MAVGGGGAAGIERIVAGDRLQHQRIVGDGARHRPDMVEREGEREDAAARHQAVGRLQPDDAAAARRIAHAAAGVGAQRHREQAGRDARARARRRAAGMMVAGSTDCAPAATAGRSSARRSRTRASRACPARSRRRRAACATQTASAVAMLSSRTFEWQVVGRPATSMMSLMPTGTPCSGPRRRPARDLGLGGLGRGQRRLAVEPDEGVELGIELLDARRAAPASARPARAPWRRWLRGRRRADGHASADPTHSPSPALHRRPRLGARIGRRLDLRGRAARPASAAAATSSGNSASALSSPARRASSSIIALSTLHLFRTNPAPPRRGAPLYGVPGSLIQSSHHL